MKIAFGSLCCCLGLIVPALAEYRIWTSSDGRKAELELKSVKPGSGDELIGTFRMRNGKQVELKSSNLDADGAQALKDWKPSSEPGADSPAPGAASASVFDDVLDGNLVRLDGKRLKSCKDATKPTKYYFFYYTASWCGPCQRFTPELVQFYNSNKNDQFELVLITSDDDEDSMEGYAKSKEMPWPQLKLSKVKQFRSKFQHGVSGIPTVVVCDLQGNIVAKTQSIPQLTSLIK